METSLTKDADKLICLIYKEFLSRRDSGVARRQAKDFAEPRQWPASFLQTFREEDIGDTLAELKRACFVRYYINGGFQLEDQGIIYMEQRFPNGIAQVLDWLAKIKNAVPFA